MLYYICMCEYGIMRALHKSMQVNQVTNKWHIGLKVNIFFMGSRQPMREQPSSSPKWDGR